MDKKLTKEEVRTPDKMTLILDRIAIWTGKNVVMVAGVVISLLVLGGAFSVFDYFKTKKENELQSEMSRIERQYTDKKTKFKEALQAENIKAPAATKKETLKQETPMPALVKATGDLEKDYGSEVTGFQDLVVKNPKSKAAQMSAIYLAEIYSEYKQPEKAIETLNKVVPKNDASDILSALAVNLKAGLLADQGNCPQAVDIWQSIIQQKKADYLHGEAKLRSAVCYEKMNDSTKAEQFYTELSKSTVSKDEPEDKAVTEDAKKYLRLLKMRASEGT